VSAPFVASLRTNRAPIVIAEGAGTIMLRVEASDIWETVRVVARPDTRVAEVKRSVIKELFPNDYLEDFVLKLRGWEMLDEESALSAAGVVDGSIILLAYRRRRPVR
jgi:hypothetical protein